MNKKDMALLAAIGFTCSGLALSPASAEAPQTIAKVPGGACPVGGKCSGGSNFFKSMTNEQLEKLNTLKTQMKESVGPKYLELKKLKTDMKDKITQENVNKEELLAIQDKINAIRADISSSRVSFIADASSIFTAEQKQEMRRKMLMRNVMGAKHHGKRSWHGKRFHGKKFHGKKFPGKAGFDKEKSSSAADENVTSEAPSVEPEKNLG